MVDLLEQYASPIARQMNMDMCNLLRLTLKCQQSCNNCSVVGKECVITIKPHKTLHVLCAHQITRLKPRKDYNECCIRGITVTHFCKSFPRTTWIRICAHQTNKASNKDNTINKQNRYQFTTIAAGHEAGMLAMARAIIAICSMWCFIVLCFACLLICGLLVILENKPCC